VITFEQVSFRYSPDTHPVLADVNVHINEGELCLVVGTTGAGKSTLLQAINGLVPHFTGGELHGRVLVDGRDTRTFPPRDLADVVGMVLQNPQRGFVTDMVEDELAYGMESLGLSGKVMRKRVEETLDLMGLADLRHRPLLSLSGGQRQRVAIGSVLTTHPRVLVLDEPTSALDPGAAEEVLAAIQRLVHDLGLTVVMSEHRLERVVQYADSLLLLTDGHAEVGDVAELMVHCPVAPPVVQLGRVAGWSPLPTSVRDARRLSGQLRRELRPVIDVETAPNDSPPVLVSHRLRHRYGPVTSLRSADVAVRAGSVVALMGRNGAGKSTLLQLAVGLLAPQEGEVQVNGVDPGTLRGSDLVQLIGYVPQEPGDLLCADSVAAECALADDDADVPDGTTADLLTRLAPGINLASHPGDLSEGQRLSLVLALVLAANPPLLLLDEPTRGLDYPAKARLAEILAGLRDAGTAVLMSTHDVELVAEVADEVVILADGEVVAAGPNDHIITASPIFAPQVAKIMAPEPFLTVTQVSAAMAASA
jgi:energy-coupling factor transport system ATP-binding protein